MYDAFGNLAAEYGAQGGGVNPCGTALCYLTADHLGSTRLLTDSSGNVLARYDYEPFGTEIPAGLGGRGQGYAAATAPDGFNLKFTGQERDFETGSDYLHARYYSAAQGRFQSPDPGNAGAEPGIRDSERICVCRQQSDDVHGSGWARVWHGYRG